MFPHERERVQDSDIQMVKDIQDLLQYKHKILINKHGQLNKIKFNFNITCFVINIYTYY